MRRVVVWTAIALAAVTTPAAADTITVGVFAPATPFEGAAARVDVANRLAVAVGKATGADAVGKVYGRAADFAAAVKKGEVQVALVDATYQAAAGSGTVVAASQRGGAWQVVARSGTKTVLSLQGKKLLVPSVGGRESDLALNALFGGELARGFFAGITASPDTASALASLGLGKADAAVVPGDATLPAGVIKIAGLGSIPGPVVVVYGSVAADRKTAIASAAGGFKADVVGTFAADDGDAVKSLARRFSSQPRRGPMAVPGVRIVVSDLVADRKLALAPADLKRFIAPVELPK